MDKRRVARELVRLAKELTAEEKTAGLGDSLFLEKNDIEFIYDIWDQHLEIGMGGEWWSGKVKNGKNVFHHRRESVDEAYKPVTVNVRKKGHSIVFDVMGGFYDVDGASFELVLR